MSKRFDLYDQSLIIDHHINMSFSQAWPLKQWYAGMEGNMIKYWHSVLQDSREPASVPSCFSQDGTELVLLIQKIAWLHHCALLRSTGEILWGISFYKDEITPTHHPIGLHCNLIHLHSEKLQAQGANCGKTWSKVNHIIGSSFWLRESRAH